MSEQIIKTDEQKGAEADVEAFTKHLGPFVVAAETTRMPMIFLDARASGNPIIFVNDAFLSLTGYDRAEVLGQSFTFLMERATDPEMLIQVKAAFEASLNVDPELRCRRKDGSAFWASVMISPVRNKSGDIVQHFASFIDLTKLKDRQAHFKMLIDELNHRVKNTLSTVQAIVHQTLRSASDPKAIRNSIDSRLFALARSHDLLTQEEWESAGLLDVVNAAMEPFVSDGRAERFVVTGDNIRIQPSAALALSVTFNELATNAVKYGALSNDAGSIKLNWKIVMPTQGERLHLLWQETGGPPVSSPSRKGFGSRVIMDGLTQQLNGTVKLDYAQDGVVCTMDIPTVTIVRGG